MTLLLGRRLPQVLFLLRLAAFGAALFGAKLWLIKGFGNDTPYWDQWSAEAAGLYDPILKGRIPWDQFLAPHNEHRILTTRLLDIVLLWANELWSPMLQMVVNAAFHTVALAALAWCLGRAAGRGAISALLLFTLIVSVVPFAWENTITGFQGQFYFVLLLSTLSIWHLMLEEPLGRRWWYGVAYAVLAFLSFASGAFAPAAAAAMLGLRWLMYGRNRRDGLAVLVLLVLFVACVAATPTVAYHASLKAHGLRHFFGALTAGFAWPAQSPWAAIGRNLPWLLVTLWLVRERVSWKDPRWFIVGMGVWLAGQTLAIAYGRADDVLTSRYLDLHSISLPINFAALAAILIATSRRFRIVMSLGALGWLWLTLGPLAGQALSSIPANIAGKRDGALRQERNLQAYLATGDAAAMKALPFFHIPFHDADGLVSILRSAEVRSVLPRNLQPTLKPLGVEARSGNAFSPGGVYPTTPDCRCSAWGSFLPGQGGNGAVGVTDIRYAAPDSWGGARTVQIFVAGYPSEAGRIELLQNGNTERLRVNDVGEDWRRVYFKVRPGPFTLRLVDANSAFWFAVSEPALGGRLEHAVDRLLGASFKFVALGCALACLLLLLSLWNVPAAAGPSHENQ